MNVSESSRLAAVHSRIASCRLCQDLFDTSKQPRRSEASPATSALFIVSQALAAGTQCLSGVPFFAPDGTLPDTGRRLEGFLNKLGFTLYPANKVVLPKGVIAPGPIGLRQAYNSEIIQCFPGRHNGRRGDKFPEKAARQCLDQHFLLEEISLVRPRVILLLGTRAAHHFFRRYAADAPHPVRLRENLNAVRDGAPLSRFTIAGTEQAVVPLIHPSGMTAGRFKQLVMDNAPLCTALTACLTPSA